MIKKLLFVCAIIISIPSMAQLSFDTDSAYVTMNPGTVEYCKIYITNDGTQPAMLTWRLLNSTLKDYGNPDGAWMLGYCDCIQCYNNDFSELIKLDTCVDPLAVGATTDWYIQVDPKTVSMRDAEWIVEVHNVTENIYDTLSYFLLEPTNSVKEINANADVLSYPNPANDEIVVDYKLSNVTAPTLSIYNLVGEKIATYPLNQLGGIKRINTSELANGVYFYNIENNGQRVITQKFNVVH